MKPKVSIDEFKAKLDKVSELEFVRLAMALDCEGSIFIACSKPYGRRVTISHQLVVSLGNTSPVLIVWLHNTFGGNIYPVKRKKQPKIGSQKPMWDWMTSAKQSAAVLERCLPYFIIKRGQAEIGLAFMRLMAQGTRGKKVSPEVVQVREDFRNVLHSLNSGQELEGDKRIN